MIFVALGANLPSSRFGAPRATLTAAIEMLVSRNVRVVRQSAWYESAPIPPSDQPWFVNAVIAIETLHAPTVLLRTLHDIEAALGRVRSSEANAPRAADLDLLDYNGEITAGEAWPCLPHPRLAARAFVVQPLAEIAPEWRHPETGETVETLRQRLSPAQTCLRVP